jgi:HsdR family type I site-specific deoxyribonuclease
VNEAVGVKTPQSIGAELMGELMPWAYGPFELLKHAESHLAGNSDFDRRIALINLDNAIELSITVFLNLHPSQRQNQTFEKDRVSKWTTNYHSKLDFFEHYLTLKKSPTRVTRGEIIWCHEVRNTLYHQDGSTVPDVKSILRAREAALWVFSVLFDVDAEALIDEALRSPDPVVSSEAVASSNQTQFLDSINSLQRTATMLLNVISGNGTESVDPKDVQSVLSLVSEQYGTLPAEYATVLAKAESIQHEVIEEGTSSLDDSELASLSKQMDRILQFIRTPLQQAVFRKLIDLGYAIADGNDINLEAAQAEPTSFMETILLKRLREALRRINPGVSENAIEAIVRQVSHLSATDVLASNQEFHKIITEGVHVSYEIGAELVQEQIRLLDYENIEDNDWLAVGNFNIESDDKIVSPDVVIFVNGLPLAVIELKNPASDGFYQLQLYQQQAPRLFIANAILAVFDGATMRVGTLGTPWQNFQVWRSEIQDEGSEGALKEVFGHERVLDLIRNFIVFKAGRKQVARYFQIDIVNKAVDSTLNAFLRQEDRRAGSVWQTQGSGLSQSLLYYLAKLCREPAMQSITIVVAADRTVVSEQLFDLFVSSEDFLKPPVLQAQSIEHMKNLLDEDNGKIIITTIGKLVPTQNINDLSMSLGRNNVLLVAYDWSGQHRYAGAVRFNLPNAVWIAFLGRLPGLRNSEERELFGEPTGIYRLHQAINDGEVLPIQYESHLINPPSLIAEVDNMNGVLSDFDQRTMKKWESYERTHEIAHDIIAHFESRLRVTDGKGLIVAASQNHAAMLYRMMIELRPQWHSDQDEHGTLKVITSETSGGYSEVQQHSRDKSRLGGLLARFSDPQDSLRLVITVDLLLANIEIPSLHTLYLTRPLRDFQLYQAISRITRPFEDKPYGLVVDYCGIAAEIEKFSRLASDSDNPNMK